jgi:membrane-associated phospholipid phosphatase
MYKIILITIIFLNVTLFSSEKKTYYDVDYNIDIPITLTSILLAIMPSTISSKLPDYMKDEKLDVNDVNSFDRMTIYNYSENSAKISDYLVASMAVMPFALNWIDNSTSFYMKESLIVVESIAISSALNSMIKYSVSRPRPYIYSGKASEEEKSSRDAHLSFFSGHTAFAFSTAVSFSTIMSDRFDKTWQKSLIWGIPLTLASTVAFLRVNAGKHFLTDVLTGAIIGSSIGWLVPYLHKKTSSNIIASGNTSGFMVSFAGSF